MSAEKQSLRPFFIMWVGQAVSLLGSRLVQFALIWWLTQETGSGTVLALATLVGLLPQVLIGPLAGTLVDRWDRRRTMMAADSLVAGATVLLGLLFWSGHIAIWHIYALLFVRAVGGSFHYPAMNASISLMVPKIHLSRVQGMNQMLQGSLSIVAAPLGALLLAFLPMQSILAIDVVTALLAIGALLVIHVPRPMPLSLGEGLAGPSFWVELRQGFHYVRNWGGLFFLLILAMGLNLVLTPTFSLMPLLVIDHFQGGALELGWMEAAWGVGIVAGGLLLGVWGGFQRRILTSLIGIVGLGIGVLTLGMTPAHWLPLAIAAALFTGLTSPIINGPIAAVVQAAVSLDMQGRVFSLMGSAAAAMTPLGLLIAGPLSDATDVRYWFVFAGAVVLVLAIVGFLSPALLNIEEDGQRMVPATKAATPASAATGA
ncbi:MAG: MFS transporter [Candidatus Promineifilaceae bacterium]|nr:MFS transporter [Candidatus Promineifilaceae bacterium]